MKQASVSKASVKLSTTAYTYNGKAKKPSATLTVGMRALKAGTDYTLTYKNNVKVGTSTSKPTVTVIGKGNYKGMKAVAFTIKKAAKPVTVAAVKREALVKTVKSKAVTVARPMAVTKNQGKQTYAKASVSVVLSVNKTAGKVAVKKGTKKGTYTIKIKVSAAGTSTYKATNKTLTCKVTIK